MVLRVNRRHQTRDAYRALLAAQGMEAQPLGEDGLVLATPLPVDQLPGFAQGACSVQDGAAQMAADLLLDGRDWSASDRVLDACAAPGGKTAHLLERADAHVLALDVDPRRCERIHDNLQRLGLNAEVIAPMRRSPPAGGMASFRRHLARRAVHRLGHRAPPSRCALAAPEQRCGAVGDGAGRLAGSALAVAQTGWAPGLRHLLGVPRRRGRSGAARSLRATPMRVEQPSPGHLLPGSAPAQGDFNDNVAGGYDGFFYARLDKAIP